MERGKRDYHDIIDDFTSGAIPERLRVLKAFFEQQDPEFKAAVEVADALNPFAAFQLLGNRQRGF